MRTDFRIVNARGSAFSEKTRKAILSGMPETLKTRIEKRLITLDLTPNAASVEAGLDRETVRKILDREGGAQLLTLKKLAPVLRTTATWLASGEGEEEPDRPEPAITKDIVYNVAVHLYRTRAADAMTEEGFANHAVILCQMLAQDAETDLHSASAYELRRQKISA